MIAASGYIFSSSTINVKTLVEELSLRKFFFNFVSFMVSSYRKHKADRSKCKCYIFHFISSSVVDASLTGQSCNWFLEYPAGDLALTTATGSNLIDHSTLMLSLSQLRIFNPKIVGRAFSIPFSKMAEAISPMSSLVRDSIFFRISGVRCTASAGLRFS